MLGEWEQARWGSLIGAAQTGFHSGNAEQLKFRAKIQY